MQLRLLHLDEGLTHQHALLDACRSAGAQELQATEHGARLRLWGKDAELNALKRTLPAADAPVLTFMGSGDFHHVTALLLEQLHAAGRAEPLTVLHFDNHPDWVHFSGGMHCGSWVNRASAVPSVRKVITLGVCSNDLRLPECKGANLSLIQNGRLELYPYASQRSRVWKRYGHGAGHTQQGHAIRWRSMEEDSESAFLSHLLSRIETDAIYITVDKDVLSTEDVSTNWDQGKMRLPQLLGIIAALGERFRIAGADIIGDYSPPIYEGRRRDVWKKRAESWMDQPRLRPDLREIATKNERSNLALLSTFREVMA